MKRILVTGAYGFAGSHFVEHAVETTNAHVVCLYSFRHLGDSLRAFPHGRVTNLFHDLNAPLGERLKELIGDVDAIINLAAQSHVERSIQDPVPFVQNNINASLHMLEFARECKSLKAFIQVSTDEVYGAAVKGDAHEEWREILPSNPYAASKAAQEALAISYWRTYGLPVVITNTMNMCGAKQDSEKYIPMCIKKIAKGERLTIHGSVGNIGSRQYLHAKSHADAILWIIKNTKIAKFDPNAESIQRPDRYNIVGDEEVDNLDLAKRISAMMEKELSYELIDFHAARPGHDRRYALDGTKIRELGWRSPFTLDDALREAIAWAKEHPEWLT